LKLFERRGGIIMKNVGQILFGVLIGSFLTASPAFAQEDAPGCKDHPLFSRMPGYRIAVCRNADFDAEDFLDPTTKQKVTIEGRKFHTEYATVKEYEFKYSRLQVSRNYVNAIKKIGGTAYENNPKDPSETSMKITKDGKEIWAKLRFNFIANYLYLTIVEKETMAQDVVADARSMATDLGTSGKTVIYGIYFDFDKADVRPESESTLKEISNMLKQDPTLKLYVVGHTDNVGGFDYNMKLSQQRAEAVVNELVSRHKADGSRLRALGVGPAAPVTTNETEEGKAKNRRVELVKQ
jgi:outer membrane protein OmpA-like peptidoglycan-associated protein